MAKPLVLIAVIVPLFLVTGCGGLQVNIPVEVQSVEQKEAALLVLVENRSSHRIKISYPVSIGILKQGQQTVFPLPQPGNYKVVVTAYIEDPGYSDVYKLVATVELPVFLNGYDVVRAKGRFVGCHIEVTDGMLFPDR